MIREKVSSPEIGSIVYCDLMAGYADHSGIYIGNNKIVHLDGSGYVECVTPKQFMARLGGFGTAISIYVSCDDEDAVGSSLVAKRAKEQIGKYRNYNFLLDNCHQFVSGCLHGDFENHHNFLWMLKDEAKLYLGINTWRVWDM